MQTRGDGSTLFSPKDLLGFLGCEHSTTLDLLRAGGKLRLDDTADDPYLDLLKTKGNEHERRYLGSLIADGRSVHEIARGPSIEDMAEATRAAMREGVDVIYQGTLLSEQWHGYSDFLLRVEKPSRLGSYSYEVADTKLAR